MTPGQYMEKSDKTSQSMDFTWAGMMKRARHQDIPSYLHTTQNWAPK